MEFAMQGVGRLPIKSWIDEQEMFSNESLVSQVTQVGSLPMAFHHVAYMPDAHAGFGMPIGGVLALDGALCPSAVGYDIGCGMVAYHLDLNISDLKPVRVQVNRLVKDVVPVGEGKDREEPSRFSETVHETLRKKHGWDFSYPAEIDVNQKVSRKIDSQLGTLGGGNHFIEFDYDPNGDVWVVIHSGSRGVGHGIAEHYMKMAQKGNAKWWAPISKDLACLPADSVEGQQYMSALSFALDWAFYNREIMMLETIGALMSVVGEVKIIEKINVHHNDANLENHFGKNVWVHRKGATRARQDERLVIPGNMGQGTAICTGKGAVDSFCSSSHGAGRKLGRREAKRTLDAEACRARLDALDVVLSAGRDGAVDEMPEAYKDFTVVMAAQSDLVDTDFILKPASVIKG